MDLEQLFKEHRPKLMAMAYRMTGSVTDAEDLVQELFASMTEHPPGQVDHLPAYLNKAIINRSLNFLASARKKREAYTGPWLPEPEVTPAAQDPSEQMILKESISYALLVLLEQLKPKERAVYVLRETMGYSYEELASLLETSEANCRQLLSRARGKIRSSASTGRRPPEAELPHSLVQSFIDAMNKGNVEQLLDCLSEDAVLVSDGGGKVLAALRPIFGRDRILTFIRGVYSRGSLQGSYRILQINGQPGVLLYQQGNVLAAFSFAVNAEHELERIYMIRNPEKLAHLVTNGASSLS